MGYYLNCTHTQLNIPASIFPDICQHLLTSGFLNPDAMSGGRHGSNGKEEAWFAWVDMAELRSALEDDDLVSVLENFRFEVDTDPDGNIIDVCFNDKSGDEEHLFAHIAAVLPGTHRIDWSGEEGEVYRWLIKNKKLRIIDACIIFKED